MDSPIFVSTRHVDAPWIAADLTVLNEAAVDVRLDVDLQLLAAKRTRDQELVRHLRRSYCNDSGQTAMHARVSRSTRFSEIPYCSVAYEMFAGG